MGSDRPVTFREALAVLRNIPPEQLLSSFDPRDYDDSLALARALQYKHGTPYCQTCGFPLGVPGFVRLPFPLGHELFGRAWPCPKCNGGRR